MNNINFYKGITEIITTFEDDNKITLKNNKFIGKLVGIMKKYKTNIHPNVKNLGFILTSMFKVLTDLGYGEDISDLYKKLDNEERFKGASAGPLILKKIPFDLHSIWKEYNNYVNSGKISHLEKNEENKDENGEEENNTNDDSSSTGSDTGSDTGSSISSSISSKDEKKTDKHTYTKKKDRFEILKNLSDFQTHTLLLFRIITLKKNLKIDYIKNYDKYFDQLLEEIKALKHKKHNEIQIKSRNSSLQNLNKKDEKIQIQKKKKHIECPKDDDVFSS